MKLGINIKRINMQEEYDVKDYMQNVKNNCVLCDAILKNPISNYMQRGNYCPGCCIRIEKERIKRMRDEKNKENEY